jgi:hypothetical protein
VIVRAVVIALAVLAFVFLMLWLSDGGRVA